MSANNMRARRANSVLIDANRDDDAPYSDCNDGDLLACLLADLRHLCDAQGWNFAQLDKDARGIYLEDLAAGPVADADFCEDQPEEEVSEGEQAARDLIAQAAIKAAYGGSSGVPMARRFAAIVSTVTE